MAKNDYLHRQRAMMQGFFDAGERIGMQKMWDYMQVVLRDPDTMGKDIFGKSRLQKVYEKTKEVANYFHPAFTDDKEADYKQEELDAVLREGCGDELVPFYDRYPELKKLGYNKSRKGWCD